MRNVVGASGIVASERGHPEKAQARLGRYYREHCDEMLEKARVYHRQHYTGAVRKRAVARQAEYRQRNPKKVRVAIKRWEQAHPHSAAQKNAARKARRYAAFVERVEKAVVFARDEGICGICGLSVDAADWHLDHIVPLSRGGVESYANVQVSHPKCNLVKSDKRLHGPPGYP